MENSFCFIDPRLGKRADISLSKILEKPDQSLPQVFNSYAGLEGFYRLIKNPRLSIDDIMENISSHTIEKCTHDNEIAVIHDTSFINPKSNRRTNFIGKRGLMTHLSLAASTSKSPEVYGALNLEFVNRTKDGKKASKTSESERWTKAALECEKKLSGLSCIHLMDREGDFFDNLCELARNEVRFVIRASWNRPVKNNPAGRLFEMMKKHPALFTLKAKISKREENRFKNKKMKKFIHLESLEKQHYQFPLILAPSITRERKMKKKSVM